MALLSALQLTKGDAQQFPFGVSPQAAADLLRKLGDKIESGEVCIMSVNVTGLASTNEYAKTDLRLILIEKWEGSGQSDDEAHISERST